MRWFPALLLIPGFALGQDAGAPWVEQFERRWRWSHFTTDSGLPSNQVRVVAEAPGGGRVWAGTNEGAAWFDDYEWRPAPGLPRSKIDSIAVTAEGPVMVIAPGGLAYVGHETGFEPLAPPAEDSRFVDCAPTADGQIYYLTRQGDELSFFRLGDEDALELPGAPRAQLGSRYFATRAGALCIRTDGELWRWTGEGWTSALELPLPSETRLAAIDPTLETGVFYVQKPASDRGLWEWSLALGTQPVAKVQGLLVSALDIDTSGRALAIFDSGEAALHDSQDWHLMLNLPVSFEMTRTLVFRPDGGLWVGTTHGLLLFRSGPSQLLYWRESSLSSANTVFEILEEPNGTVWTGTGNGVEIRTGEGAVERIETIADTRLGAVTGLARDVEGGIWISSGEGNFDGAFRYEGGEWQHFGADEGLDAWGVHKIRPDRRGRLWFAGLGKSYDTPEDQQPGAFLLEGGQFTRWSTEDGLPCNRVYAFAEAPDGSLWFGTKHGLARRRAGSWKYWDTGSKLRANRIYTLDVDAENRVWFGHQIDGAGLGTIDERDEPFYHTRKLGFLDDDVTDVRTDQTGTAWFATSKGIARPVHESWWFFTADSGLNKSTALSVFRGAERLYIGTGGGGTNVLSSPQEATPAPRLRVDEPVVAGNAALVRWRTFGYWGEAGNANTRFRLDSGPWSEWSSTNEFNATGLTRERHRFTIQTRDRFGNHDPQGRTLEFDVPLPLPLQPRFAVPVYGAIGVLGLLSLALLAKRRRQQAALTASERNFRHVAENIQEVFWLTDWKTRQVLYVSPAYETIWGEPCQALIDDPRSWSNSIHEDDVERVVDVFEREAEHGSYSIEYRIRRQDGSIRWIDDRAFPIKNENGVTFRVAGVSEDVTERKRSERRQALLTQELDHRVKNNLAWVLALSEKTLATTSSSAEFQESFSGRIRAMARTHEALASHQWDGMRFAELARLAIEPYCAGDSERVALDVDDTVLPAKASSSIGLALHELATNATKYGALSARSGRVLITGRVNGTGLIINWSESGGPPVVEPKHLGYGTSLIQGFVEHQLGGEAQFDFRPEGLACELRVPMEQA